MGRDTGWTGLVAVREGSAHPHRSRNVGGTTTIAPATVPVASLGHNKGVHARLASVLFCCVFASACGTDGYDRGEYCGAVGVTIKGAVDDAGRPMDEFNEADRRRSFLRLAEMGPSNLREDWRTIAGLFGGERGPDGFFAAAESERRVKEHVKKECGIEIDAF